MKIAIYEIYGLNKNAGGPSGYLWHLNEGLSRVGHEGIAFLIGHADAAMSRPAPSRAAERLRRVSPTLWTLAKSFGPTRLRKIWVDAFRRPVDAYFLPEKVEAQLLAERYDAIHCHCTPDAVAAHNSLVRLGLRDTTKLVLTSHCPEKPSQERLAGYIAHGLHRSLAPRMLRALDAIDARAIEVADHLLFPCAEALEVYTQSWPGFSAAIAGKPIDYVITGVVNPEIGDPDMWKSALPQGRTLLSYAGRHNTIKGYDILAQAIPPLLREDNVSMVVAGHQGPLFAPEDPNWIEVGWTRNVQELIKACDIFVLPNRNTYFDLVAIEVMALGKPIVATNTGGNKALARLSDGVVLCETSPDSMRETLRELASNKALIAELGEKNRAVFLENMEAAIFARNYKSVLRKIVRADAERVAI